MQIHEPKKLKDGNIEYTPGLGNIKFTKEEFDHISRRVKSINQSITIESDGRTFLIEFDPKELMELIQKEIEK